MTRSPFPRLRSRIAGAAAVVFAFSLLVAGPADAATTPSDVTAATSSATAAGPASGPAKALITDGFRAGNIISDAVFFDSSTMTPDSIDAFFRSKVASCRAGYVCLKDYRQNTPNRAADSYCRGYQGAPNESAATIIYKVAQSCGINPQVFIVMLQKEQSLVTHTWPSSWRYSMALGQGCPDTAPCDPAYAGFFYQIYGAGRQMKIYAEGRWFTYYAPGKTWNILYHPNSACGRGPVYVENVATSALYYYTPYQPNAAALRAGYGEGDGCSSYGNRNFYNYFTDWFGSTQGRYPTRGVILPRGGDKIYLLMDGVKYHIASPADLAPFNAVLGATQVVSPGFVSSLPEGAQVTRYVHDPRTGTLYLLEPDGTKHRFQTAEQVARFGYPFSTYVNLNAATADAFRTGSDVNDYFRSGSSPQIYLFQGGAKRYVATIEMWNTLTRGAPTYVASMNTATADAMPFGRVLIAPNKLVTAAGTSEVYLVLPGDRLLYVPSFALAAEFGSSSYTSLPRGTLSANPRVDGALSPIVECGSARYIIAGGTLARINGSDVGGLRSAKLLESECAGFPRSSAQVSAPFFVQPSGRGEVYAVMNGTLRHVLTPGELNALNGNRPLTLLKWSQETVNWIGVGSPYLPEGAFVSVQGRGEVYRFTDGSLHHVRAFSTLLALNGGAVPSIRTLTTDQFARFQVGSPILTERTDFVQFVGSPEVYQYKDQALHHVQRLEALLSLGGGKVPPILSLAARFRPDYPVGAPIP